MEKNSGLEKRRHSRVAVASLVVIRCDVKANIGDKEKCEFHTHTENISEGGINVILDHELRRQDIVDLKLYLTGRYSPIECKGKVAWAKLISPEGIKPGLFATGIEFTEYNDEAKDALRKIISCF